MENRINAIASEFFTNFGLKFENLEVIKKEENIFLIKFESSDSGRFIGPQGKNLEAITLVLKMIISRNILELENPKIYIEVNDYLASKDERLKNFIISKVKIVEKTGKDLKLLNFYSAYERKKIHAFVAEYGNPSIFTKSIGEGKERRLYICKTDNKLEIDLDSMEI